MDNTIKNQQDADYIICLQDAPLAQKGHLNRLASVGLFFVWTGAFFAFLPISSCISSNIILTVLLLFLLLRDY